MRFFRRWTKQAQPTTRAQGSDIDGASAGEAERALAKAGVTLRARDFTRTSSDARSAAAFAGLVASASAWG